MVAKVDRKARAEAIKAKEAMPAKIKAAFDAVKKAEAALFKYYSPIPGLPGPEEEKASKTYEKARAHYKALTNLKTPKQKKLEAERDKIVKSINNFSQTKEYQLHHMLQKIAKIRETRQLTVDETNLQKLFFN